MSKIEKQVDQFIINLSTYRNLLLKEKYIDYFIENEERIKTLIALSDQTLVDIPFSFIAWIITGNNAKYLNIDLIGDIMTTYPTFKKLYTSIPLKSLLDERLKSLLQFTEDLIITPIEDILAELEDE